MPIIADFLTTTEVLTVVGQRLRQRRLERSLLADDLAKHAGVNRKTILALESGADIKLSSLIKILRSMNMLGLLEVAIPDRLPTGAGLVNGTYPRVRASHSKGKSRGKV